MMGHFSMQSPRFRGMWFAPRQGLSENRALIGELSKIGVEIHNAGQKTLQINCAPEKDPLVSDVFTRHNATGHYQSNIKPVPVTYVPHVPNDPLHTREFAYSLERTYPYYLPNH